MSERGKPSGQCILVVEDDEVLRELLAHQLRHHGHEVLEAGTGAQARARVEEHKPDLVLLDVNLPDETGWQVCASLKADPHTRTIPVVILTALDSSRDRWQGWEAGADDFLSKPFQPQELLIRVRSLLRLRELYRSQVEAEQLRIRLESQQEFERLKESFISILSHELKTPLTVLKGYVSVLRDLRGRPASARVLDESMDDMVSALGQLEALIRELLDYSRMRAGVLNFRRRPAELRALLRSAAEGVQPAAGEKGVVLDLDFPSRPVRVRVDSARLAGAVVHLLENAVKFTPPGGRVVVGCRDRGDRVVIRVRDSGVGIAPEERQRIFEPFYQSEAFMTRRFGGVGLGLASARHIVADHGGEIRVRSRPGHGSLFEIRLPRSHYDARELLARLRRSEGGPEGAQEALPQGD